MVDFPPKAKRSVALTSASKLDAKDRAMGFPLRRGSTRFSSEFRFFLHIWCLPRRLATQRGQLVLLVGWTISDPGL